MNVGILTFHMAHNCGAMLQTYALYKSINSLVPCTCKVIDYRLREIFDKYERLLHTEPVPPRRLKFDQYMKHLLPLSTQVNDLTEATEYDLYVIGSDQVWNPDITHGYKDAYFAKCFPSDSYCIAYAASTGKHIEDPEAFCRMLGRFRYIGVRESWAKKELTPYYTGEIAWCLDPVLLLETEQWQYSFPQQERQPYILIYAFEVTRGEYQQIEEWAMQLHLNVIELVTHERLKWPGVIYEDVYGPEEFVAFVQHATYIYTDSYHGALFSIIFQKPFHCLTHGYGENERIRDIRERLAIMQNEDGFYTTTEQTQQRLMDGRIESVRFLEMALKQVTNEKAEF